MSHTILPVLYYVFFFILYINSVKPCLKVPVHHLQLHLLKTPTLGTDPRLPSCFYPGFSGLSPLRQPTYGISFFHHIQLFCNACSSRYKYGSLRSFLSCIQSFSLASFYASVTHWPAEALLTTQPTITIFLKCQTRQQKPKNAPNKENIKYQPLESPQSSQL